MVSFLAAAVERHALKCCVPDMRPVSLLSSLLLATQRTRASMPHRGSKETILSESRDVAKRKKDSMTAIFPLYWDKSAHHEIRDFYAHMALMDERRFARYFCRYIGILLGNIPYIIKIFGQTKRRASQASCTCAQFFISILCKSR